MSTPIPHNRARFTAEEIARVTGGALSEGDGGVAATGVVIDSRAVTPGCLFVALRGPRHDAHRFVPDAVGAGAAAVLVEHGAALPEGLGAAVVRVRDTTRALGDLAAAHRAAWPGTVVAITGSAGKTSTKELTAAGLAAAGATVHRTAGNLNNLVGLPMSILELDGVHDVAVLELGTNRPGEIARLAEIARPDVAVVTLVAVAHTEGLGSLDAVAREKWALIEALGPDGTAVLHGDDPSLRALAPGRGGARTLWFGRGEDADVRLSAWDVSDRLETRARIALREGGRSLEVPLALVGEAAALNAAAAVAVAVALGRDVRAAAAGLAGVSPGPGRMRPRRMPGGALLLDDTYNANPKSVSMAIETATHLARARRGATIAVLGDMKELGERSTDEHVTVGREAAAAGVSLLAACGKEMRHAASAARQASARMEVHHFADAMDAVRRVSEEAGARDVVLVKGSRSMQMERVVEALAMSEGAP